MLCSTIFITTCLQLSYTHILPTLVHTTDHVPFLLVHQIDLPNVVSPNGLHHYTHIHSNLESISGETSAYPKNGFGPSSNHHLITTSTGQEAFLRMWRLDPLMGAGMVHCPILPIFSIILRPRRFEGCSTASPGYLSDSSCLSE
jgi:hypothetical protein